MDALPYWIHQADCYCPECTEDICKHLLASGIPAEDEDDQSSYDSDQWPKGEFSGDECDSPNHCGSMGDCVNAITLADGTKVGALLDNTMTTDGAVYIREQHKDNPSEVTALWVEHFGIELPDIDQLGDGYFDRFDICEAYYALEYDWNVSGMLQERPSNQRRNASIGHQLARMRFKPRPSLGGRESLEENGRAIYDTAARRFGLTK